MVRGTDLAMTAFAEGRLATLGMVDFREPGDGSGRKPLDGAPGKWHVF